MPSQRRSGRPASWPTSSAPWATNSWRPGRPISSTSRRESRGTWRDGRRPTCRAWTRLPSSSRTTWRPRWPRPCPASVSLAWRSRPARRPPTRPSSRAPTGSPRWSVWPGCSSPSPMPPPVPTWRVEPRSSPSTATPGRSSSIRTWPSPPPAAPGLREGGGKKPIPYLPIEPEANPFLGVRALRLAAVRPEVFVTQLRAAYRAAAHGQVKVMAPMIADATDAATLLELAERARAGLEADGIAHGEVALGVMLEIPSAILVADSYFGRIAFGSLGTNDLLQYTLAVDRGNPQLERYQDSLHPALLGLVARSVEAAERAGIELSVCGEMAGDATAALALVGLGVRKLSMAAGSLPEVRRTIRGSDFAELRSAAGGALREPSAVAVRARFEALRAGALA